MRLCFFSKFNIFIKNLEIINNKGWTKHSIQICFTFNYRLTVHGAWFHKLNIFQKFVK